MMFTFLKDEGVESAEGWVSFSHQVMFQKSRKRDSVISAGSSVEIKPLRPKVVEFFASSMWSQ